MTASGIQLTVPGSTVKSILPREFVKNCNDDHTNIQIWKRNDGKGFTDDGIRNSIDGILKYCQINPSSRIRQILAKLIF